MSGRAETASGLAAQFATITISSGTTVFLAKADANGNYAFDRSGRDLYHPIHSHHQRPAVYFAAKDHRNRRIDLQPGPGAGYYLTGHLSGATSVGALKAIVTSRTTGASILAITNSTGTFRVMLPTDNYFINVQSGSLVIWMDLFVSPGCHGPASAGAGSDSIRNGLVRH